MRRQVRRRKFKALYTSSVATIQQPRLPDTPLSLCVRCVSPFHTAECFCCGSGNYYIPRTSGTPQPQVLPALHQLQSKYCGHRHHTANRRVCVLLQAIRRMRYICKDAPHSRHKKTSVFASHGDTKTNAPKLPTRKRGKYSTQHPLTNIYPAISSSDNGPGICAVHDRRKKRKKLRTVKSVLLLGYYIIVFFFFVPMTALVIGITF